MTKFDISIIALYVKKYFNSGQGVHCGRGKSMVGKLGPLYHGREGRANYFIMVGKVGQTTSSW